MDVTVVGELAFQAVIRPHREPTKPIFLVLGSLDRRAFCDCLLYVHELESPPLGLKPGKHRTRTHRLLQDRTRRPRETRFVARQPCVALDHLTTPFGLRSPRRVPSH